MTNAQQLIEAVVEAQRRGDYVEAERILRDLLIESPDHAEALNDLGRIVLADGRIDEAIRCFERAIETSPHLGQAHFNLAVVFRGQNQLESAAKHYAKAAELLPDLATTHYHLGLVLRDLGLAVEALRSMRKAVDLSPASLESRSRLADMLTEMGQFAEAIQAYDQVIELDPNHLSAWLTKGCIHEALHQEEEAVVCLKKVLSLDSTLDDVRLKLGKLLLKTRRTDNALRIFNEAVKRRPDWPEAQYELSLALMSKGRLSEAWPAFESRKACQIGAWLTHSLPEWDGSNGDRKTILVYGEQGISHEIMLASCFPEVIAESRHCIIECDPRLQTLFMRSFPSATVISANTRPVDSGSELGRAIDAQVASGSLPGRYRTKFRQFPEQPRYLQCDLAGKAAWRERLDALGDGLKVGLVRPDTEKEPHASIPWDGLLTMRDCRWINLVDTKGARTSPDGVTVHDLSGQGEEKNVDQLAALAASLDLVISTDHFTAHLAAAVGTPTWIILSEETDWRWLLDNRRSPWHPSMRLFRKTHEESWDAVLTRVRCELVDRLVRQGMEQPRVHVRSKAAQHQASLIGQEAECSRRPPIPPCVRFRTTRSRWAGQPIPRVSSPRDSTHQSALPVSRQAEDRRNRLRGAPCTSLARPSDASSKNCQRSRTSRLLTILKPWPTSHRESRRSLRPNIRITFGTSTATSGCDCELPLDCFCPLGVASLDLRSEQRERFLCLVRKHPLSAATRGPQRWPFGWWIVVVVDHFSRRTMGFHVFRNQPSSADVQDFLDSIIEECGESPKHIVSDQGTQFDCQEYRDWCKSRGIKWRYGAVGQHGSIAVVERFILTMKTILGRAFAFLMKRETIERELDLVFLWYNEHKPHSTLGGRTPDEVYHRRFPGNRKPRFEPRPGAPVGDGSCRSKVKTKSVRQHATALARSEWTRGSPCAKPGTPVRGEVGQKIVIEMDNLEGRSHLPVISIRPAA